MLLPPPVFLAVVQVFAPLAARWAFWTSTSAAPAFHVCSASKARTSTSVPRGECYTVLQVSGHRRVSLASLGPSLGPQAQAK